MSTGAEAIFWRRVRNYVQMGFELNVVYPVFELDSKSGQCCLPIPGHCPFLTDIAWRQVEQFH